MYNFIRLQYIMSKITEEEVRILCDKYKIQKEKIEEILSYK